jgi:riboflavin synthase
VFTGIVREKGRVVSADRDGALRLRIAAPRTASQTEVGDSIAVSGCCLTAVAAGDGELAFDAVDETLSRTTLGSLQADDEVNLEPALRAGEPLGGHYVQGHVDGVARVLANESSRLSLQPPAELLRYCVEKGSIAVDGVSLTIAALDGDGIEIALVPHTLAETTLGGLGPGDEANIEVDLLAKYVERLGVPSGP